VPLDKYYMGNAVLRSANHPDMLCYEATYGLWWFHGDCGETLECRDAVARAAVMPRCIEEDSLALERARGISPCRMLVYLLCGIYKNPPPLPPLSERVVV
jgi:hypothetical protein